MTLVDGKPFGQKCLHDDPVYMNAKIVPPSTRPVLMSICMRIKCLQMICRAFRIHIITVSYLHIPGMV